MQPATTAAADVIRAAQEKVRGPAALMLVVGILNCCLGGLSIGGILNSGFFMKGAIVVGILGIIGGQRLRQLQSEQLVKIASIAILLPVSLCFVVGLPVGVWSLNTLGKPEVKDAFRVNEPLRYRFRRRW
jgi:hypothetical protein